jgi:two-component system, OmpR family, sensor kinase
VPGPREPEGLPPWRRWLASVRVRFVAWLVVLLAVGLGMTIAAAQLILLQRLDERIDRELRQEVEELRSLAAGLDPATGEPFGGEADRLFEVFLSRNLPARNETMLTFVDGEPFRRSLGEPPARLDREPSLVRRWANLRTTDRGHVTLDPVGRVEFLAVPTRLAGRPVGVFVVAYFRDLERAELDEALRVTAAVGAIVVLLAAGIAWNVAGRVLEPVRAVTATARTISDTDLSQRIPVTGADEVSVLTATFNRMLDRLETAFASQRAFIDDAGHELRTPITIIRGHLELLDAGDPVDREATLPLVVDELDRMHRIVEDLLLLAKAQQPDFLTLEAVDVGELTAAVAAKAQGLARRDWRVEEAGRARIIADRQRLTQALVQLCHNAAQHTDEGAVVALGSAVRDGGARLWVRDTGPGVPDDERERIFERFARGAAGPGRGEGAGLGLSIVRAIAEAHGGRVELDSRPQAGATFTIVVPVDQADRR